MRRYVPMLVLFLLPAGNLSAQGLLIPEDKHLPPLAMLNHKVVITIDDQVATTHVEQTFRNHSHGVLEATYIFPIPRGASVNKFTMWVNGTEVKGEMVEADKARQIYTSIVRRTQDPGLLEYMGNNLLRLRVFPIPAKGDQKVSFSYTAVLQREADLVEYLYPLKTDGKATSTLEDFSITAKIKSQHMIQNVYSPTHALAVQRASDYDVTIQFERKQGLLDKDFQLFYTLGSKDVGLTTLTHRLMAREPGYFMALITPRMELRKSYQIARDLVLALDTSGSMRGAKMEQAKQAIKRCLEALTSKDRFALINFGTTVNRYKDDLVDATSEQLAQASQWIDSLEATGGTAIDAALESALQLRTKDEGRSFTIIFFTDGQPTIGETDPAKILKNVSARNTANTRIFTFGVGDDVNATMLDQLADQTRALSTYVRPEENISVKVASLSNKISHPVLTNLQLTVTNDIRLTEMYPPQLPDLFHGGQLIVLGRYSGKGPAALKLSGMVGMEKKEFVYDITLPDRTSKDRDFIEPLWARRKVGYMLDQIRRNGAAKELVDEVVRLAKKYGITTPYTSYLIVPDGPMPVIWNRRGQGGRPPAFPPALATSAPGGGGRTVADFARQAQQKQGGLATQRDEYASRSLAKAAQQAKKEQDGSRVSADAINKKEVYEKARSLLAQRDQKAVQVGQLGIDLSVQMNHLRNQSRLEQTAIRKVNGRNCLELGGVWIDEEFTEKTALVTIKAQSDAYFRILELHPQMREVFGLGNHLVWITPSGTALILDSRAGKEKLSDQDIDKLFATKK